VQQRLEHKQPGHLAVQQDEGRVLPVGDPLEEVVPTREEDNQGRHGKGTDVGAVHEVAYDLLALVLEQEVALGGLEVDGAEHDVKDSHNSDAERLTNGGNVAEIVWQ
jgi:hypothetical protein